MKNIAAGIVLFNPDIIRLRENINAIIEQVSFVLLIDNFSLNIREIESEFSGIKNIILIKNNKNLGIASALNQIVNYCGHRNCEWVLTLDQDSVVPNNIIKNFSKYINFESVAIITPTIHDRNDRIDRSIVTNRSCVDYEYISKCITSASLINIQICKKLGLFDKEMFIDLVDFDYCIRLLKANYKILRVNKVVLTHQLGSLKVYRFLGKKIFVTNHSKERIYYYSRNSIYYMNKHKDWLSKREVYLDLIKKVVKIIFFENQKCNKIIFLLHGIIDGINNKMGQLEVN